MRENPASETVESRHTSRHSDEADHDLRYVTRRYDKSGAVRALYWQRPDQPVIRIDRGKRETWEEAATRLNRLADAGDIAAIDAAAIAARRRPPSMRRARPADGLIYAIQGAPDGPVKIGYTASQETLDKRLRSLQTGSAEPLRVIATVPGDRLLEGRLHYVLESARMQGEWFAWTPLAQRAIEAGLSWRFVIYDT